MEALVGQYICLVTDENGNKVIGVMKVPSPKRIEAETVAVRKNDVDSSAQASNSSWPVRLKRLMGQRDTTI